MPQDSQTGSQGCENGYTNADEIAKLLKAEREDGNSNKFKWKDRLVVIKTGPSAVVTRATLKAVKAVVYGVKTDNRWVIYEVAPDVFEKNSRQSKSKGHNENYRLVGRKTIREVGTRISLASQ